MMTALKRILVHYRVWFLFINRAMDGNAEERGLLSLQINPFGSRKAL